MVLLSRWVEKTFDQINYYLPMSKNDLYEMDIAVIMV
jgi:hypothetical protein